MAKAFPAFEEDAILVPRNGDLSKAGGEVGRTGLIQFSGYVDEEWLKDLKGIGWGLRGSRAMQTYREMSDNDPTIGALFNAVCWLSRVVEWTVESEAANDPRVELIEAAKDGMAHTWEDLLSEIIRGTLAYGWQVHEIVYGAMPYGVGWTKLPIRSQDSLIRWEFDAKNHATHMVQSTLPDYKQVAIPLSKCLHFRTESIKDNPEGRSILRNAYRPWYFKKHMEQIEGIGVERDLAGLPVAYVPAGIIDKTLPNADEIFENIKQIVTGIHRDEQEGVVMPLSYDESGNPLYKLELLSTGGQRQLDINAIINRYDLRILQLCLADFIQVGHEKTGSFALASSKTNLFAVAISVFLKQIAAEFNRQAIPDLCMLNGLSGEDCPQLVPGDIESQDLAELGTYLQALSSIGIPLGGDPVLENHLRAIAKLPALTPEQVKEREAMGPMGPLLTPPGAEEDEEEEPKEEPVKKAEDGGGRWVTINGTAVFIEEGQSVDDAVEERFGDEDDGGDEADKTGVHRPRGITDDQRKAARSYQSTGYKNVNAALRGQGEHTAKSRSIQQQLDRAFKNTRGLKSDLTVYRGMRSTGLAELRRGSVITDHGFVSTSTDRRIATVFAGGVRDANERATVTIRARRGTRAIRISHLTGTEAQGEILLPRGSRFRVTRVSRGRNGYQVDAEII